MEGGEGLEGTVTPGYGEMQESYQVGWELGLGGALSAFLLHLLGPRQGPG